MKLSLMDLIAKWRSDPTARATSRIARRECADELEAALEDYGTEPTCSHGYGWENEHHRVRCSIPGPASPEPNALDLADEMDEYRDQMQGGPHDLLLRAAAALRVKTTSEPTREQIAEAMALVCRPAHYGNNFPEMADAVLALFRAEAKPECLCDSPLLAYNENKCPAHPKA